MQRITKVVLVSTREDANYGAILIHIDLCTVLRIIKGLKRLRVVVNVQ